MRKKNRAAAWQIAAGALVGAVCLWYSLRDSDSSALAIRLAAVSWSWVGLAVLGVVLVSTCKALRWSWIYPPSSSPPRFSAFFSVLLIAQSLNLLVPIRLGELARIGLMQEEGKPAGTTLGTITIEKSLDLLAVALILLLVVPLGGAPGWLQAHTGPQALLSAVALAATLVLLGALRRPLLAILQALPIPRLPLLGWAGDRVIGVLRSFLDSLASLGGRRLVLVLALTAGSWALSAAVILALFVACGISPGLQAAVLLMIALTFSNLAPTPPAMIGVVSAVTQFVLAPYGIPPAQLIAFGGILNAVVVGPPVLIGGAFAGQRIVRALLAAQGKRQLWRALGLSGAGRPADEP